jgi:hypothetical protein
MQQYPGLGSFASSTQPCSLVYECTCFLHLLALNCCSCLVVGRNHTSACCFSYFFLPAYRIHTRHGIKFARRSRENDSRSSGCHHRQIQQVCPLTSNVVMHTARGRPKYSLQCYVQLSAGCSLAVALPLKMALLHLGCENLHSSAYSRNSFACNGQVRVARHVCVIQHTCT